MRDDTIFQHMAVAASSVAVLLLLAPLASRTASTAPALQQVPEPTLSHVVPDEVDAPVNVPTGLNPIARFDDFSWRSFVALNWPAKTDGPERGLADSMKKIGVVDGPTVWDTWKADYEIFQPGGGEPSEWDSYVAVTPCQVRAVSTPTESRDKIIGSFTKIGGFNQAGFGVDAGPLVAQNRTYVRYELRVNRQEYNFVRDRKLYLPQSIPPETPARFPDGSIAVKAAWRELKPEELAGLKGRYYIVETLTVDPLSGQCRRVHMALIGLHIVQKTVRRPQWVWSSFEHVDNVPEGEPLPQRRYALNNGQVGEQQPDPATAPPPLTLEALKKNPNPIAMQVVRANAIAESTRTTNTKYRQALQGTVWEHYQLVLTQWPTAPLQPKGAPFPNAVQPQPPTNTANVSMETYFQHPSQSCMTCHDIARRNKMDFEWFILMRAASDEPGPFLPTADAAAVAVTSPRARARQRALDELRQFMAERK